MQIDRKDSTPRMSQIVVHNETVYLSGQTAGPASDTTDMAEQTRICLDKVNALLEEAGSSAEHMLSATVYVRDMKDFAAMNEVWDSWFADKPKPARASVQAQMARPSILVELSVIAAVNHDS